MFTIGQLARRLNRSESWIRKYEARIGIKSHRLDNGTKGGLRIYSIEDLERFRGWIDSRGDPAA